MCEAVYADGIVKSLCWVCGGCSVFQATFISACCPVQVLSEVSDRH